jgi:hypothetical protein
VRKKENTNAPTLPSPASGGGEGPAQGNTDRDPTLPTPASRGGKEHGTAGAMCPFCRSKDTEVISLFGSQVMTMQCKCRACGNFFEASKY